MRDIQIGDFIKCHDAEDMVDTMNELAKEGIETEFIYQREGIKGLWLEVTGYDKGRN